MTKPDAPPLCVDLDGTLIAGDTLYLSVAMLARRRPWALAALPVALLGGRARLKRAVCDRLVIDAAALPYRASVVEFLREQRAAGRRLVLATAADRRIAQAVAAHLGLFDGIVASDGTMNAKGAGKGAAIRAALGEGEFDYVGDHLADLPVLRAARRGYLVAPSPALLARARAECRIERVFEA
jgi:phosphoserine phosphatase